MTGSSFCKRCDTINLPLGGYIELELAELSDDTINIPASYQLIASSLSIPNIQSYPNSFYTDRLAFSFSQENEKKIQRIMPVHIGTQEITIRPVNANQKEITLTLNIGHPLR